VHSKWAHGSRIAGRLRPPAHPRAAIGLGWLSGLVLAALVSLLPTEAQANSMTKKLLKSKSYKVRLQAAIYLSRLRDPKTVKPLIKCVKRDKHYLVRAFCANALGKIGSAKALPALKKRSKDKNSFVRRKIKQAIERIHAQVSVSGGRGYQIKYKPRAKLFVVVKPPRKRRWGVSKRVARFTQRSLRLQLNDQSRFEVARPGAKPPNRWIKRRRIPAVAVTMTITKIRRRKRGRTVTVIAQAHALVTRYPSKSVKLISDTEAQSSQQIKSARMGRSKLENLYRYLERQAVDGVIKRISQRLSGL
jgi:HEAT repeats